MLRRFALALFAVQLSTAEDLDLSKYLHEALFSRLGGAISMPQKTHLICHSDGIITGDARWPSNFGCVVMFRNVRVLPVHVKYSEMKLDPIADSIVGKTLPFVNCTGKNLPIDDKISFKHTQGAVITKSVKVVKGENTDFGGDIKFPLDIGKLNIKKTLSFTEEQTDTQAKSELTEETIEQRVQFTLDPYTVREVRLQRKLTTGYIEFEGIVEVEGDVYIGAKRKEDGYVFDGARSVGKLQDLLPKPSRTLSLKGNMSNVKGEAIERIIRDFSATDHPACSAK